jgi:hypothetical protein
MSVYASVQLDRGDTPLYAVVSLTAWQSLDADKIAAAEPWI